MESGPKNRTKKNPSQLNGTLETLERERESEIIEKKNMSSKMFKVTKMQKQERHGDTGKTKGAQTKNHFKSQGTRRPNDGPQNMSASTETQEDWRQTESRPKLIHHKAASDDITCSCERSLEKQSNAFAKRMRAKIKKNL